jgi:hypothetical protein
MTVNQNWIVTQLDAYPEFAGTEDVVFSVHWRLNGTDGAHEASTYGSVVLNLDAESSFTPYEDLTQEQVVGWVKDALGEEQVAQQEAFVAKQIADQINPPVVSPPLPWDE